MFPVNNEECRNRSIFFLNCLVRTSERVNKFGLDNNGSSLTTVADNEVGNLLEICLRQIVVMDEFLRGYPWVLCSVVGQL